MPPRIPPALRVIVWLLIAGCGQRGASERAEPPSGAGSETHPAPETTLVPPDTARASGATPEPPARMAEPAPEASDPGEGSPPEGSQPGPGTTTPAEPPKGPEAPPPPRVVDPGGVVEVKAAKAGLSRIGAEKCRTCHKVQFESWSASAHARRTPPLDCESCHGAGSEYRVLSVMKDPQKARAAGLVPPDREFCVLCHRSGWSEEMMKRAHAHKPAAGAP